MLQTHHKNRCSIKRKRFEWAIGMGRSVGRYADVLRERERPNANNDEMERANGLEYNQIQQSTQQIHPRHKRANTICWQKEKTHSSANKLLSIRAN